MMTFSSDLINI